jgi:hypothetical protein
MVVPHRRRYPADTVTEATGIFTAWLGLFAGLTVTAAFSPRLHCCRTE